MSGHPQPQARLSVVVIFYDMAREAPRTLYTLSAAYQRGVRAEDYEVIAVDNGSPVPLGADILQGLGPNFRMLRIEDAHPSPAGAINQAVASCASEHVAVMIDGARMATPGVVRSALDCLERFDRALVVTVGFHLGPQQQSQSVLKGYNQAVEDELLATIDWRANGYLLYQVCAPAGSSRGLWFGSLAESNLFFMPRALYEALEGFDERFDLPGGGLANLDFYRRACERKDVTLISLLGEATFHQFHGGTMTNRPADKVPEEMRRYREQYRAIRGVEYVTPSQHPRLYGYARREVLDWYRKASAIVLSDLKSRDRVAREAAAAELERPSGAPQESGAAAAAKEQEGLRPGEPNHRAYVGEASNYDRLAALQFGLLTMLGLREDHRLLDIGCGSLRGGRLFIPYLGAERYFGIEPNRWLVDSAIAHELGEDLVRLKKPTFNDNGDFELGVFDRQFNYVLAQSIFNHTGVSQLEACLRQLPRVLAPAGMLVATFVERATDFYSDHWVYPGLNHYSWATLTGIAGRHGLSCRKLDWPHPLQTWFVAVRQEEDGLLDELAGRGVDPLPDEIVLTPRKFAAKNAGRPMQFLRHGSDY